MKLLFFIHGLTGGGAERVLSILANGLVERGYSVRIAYTDLYFDKKYTLDNKIEEVYIFDKKKKAGIFNRLLFYFYTKTNKYIRIRKQVVLYKPDVVVSFITPLNNDVIISLIGIKVPLIVCEHSKVSRFYSIKTNTLRRFLYPFASAITVLTKHDLKLWENKYRNVVYIPNPCNIDLNNQDVVKREKVVLAVGRVNQWKIKGFDNLIKCWNKLQDDFPEWSCKIAGSFSDYKIKELSNNIPKGSLARVEFLGFREDVIDLFRSVEIFCLTSRVEGLPMVLIEAMKSGCCCVSFDVETGPNEIIEDGVSGLLVKNQDIYDLEIKMRRLMSDSNLRHRLSKNAPFSVERFSLDNILSKWDCLLHSIIP